MTTTTDRHVTTTARTATRDEAKLCSCVPDGMESLSVSVRGQR